MPHYAVRIRATVEKTITVECEDEQNVAELAHGQFSVLCDDTPEKYSEDIVSVQRLPDQHGQHSVDMQ